MFMFDVIFVEFCQHFVLSCVSECGCANREPNGYIYFESKKKKNGCSKRKLA